MIGAVAWLDRLGHRAARSAIAPYRSWVGTDRRAVRMHERRGCLAGLAWPPCGALGDRALPQG